MDIYVLETNPHVTVFLKAIFSSMQANDTVIFFDDVDSLLDRVKKLAAFDLVIFDVVVQGVGLTLVEELQQLTAEGHCAIIVYTFDADDALIDQAIGLGVHSYIIKRINPTDNFQAIMRAIDSIRNSSLGQWG